MPNSNSEYLAEIRDRLHASYDYILDGPKLQALVRAVQKLLGDGPLAADLGGVLQPEPVQRCVRGCLRPRV